jgi:recombination protein RecA
MNTRAIERLLMSKKTSKPKSQDFLSTGSTLLNLACTGNVNRGLLKGKYYYLVGDSSSGKTWLSLTCFAEACRSPAFNDYRLIFDNAEDGALMDWERFFGKKVADRVEPPAGTKDDPKYSHTIEDFYYHLDDCREDGRPVIYVLDSMDALSDENELELVSKQKKASRAGKEGPESYGTNKAKRNSSGMRQIMPFLRDTGSILILISQTRDNIAKFSFNKKTRSGGKSLTFYATLEMWTAQAGKITKLVGSGKEKQKVEMGIKSQIHIVKNRVNGKDRTVTVPIYHSYGIDDIGCCVDYLVTQGVWPKKAGRANARDFDFVGTREEIVHHIEENELEKELFGLVQDQWDKVEESSAIHRKARYE